MNTTPSPTRIVIAGGGFAGAKCAETLPGVLAPDNSLDDAARTLAESGQGALIVTRADGALEGIVTMTDLARATSAGATRATPAAKFMTRRPVAVNLDDRAIVAATLLREHALKHVPVVTGRERRVVGILRARRLLMHVFRVRDTGAATHRRRHPHGGMNDSNRTIEPARTPLSFMAPELLLALIALGVFAGIVVFAWIWTSAPERQPTVEAEAARLAQQIAWLENRIELARRESWEPSLGDQIGGQLDRTRGELEGLCRDRS